MKSVKEIVKSALTMFRGKLLTSTITDGDTTHALSIDGAYDLQNFVVDMGTISSLPVTKTVQGVNSSMVVLDSTLGTPSAQTSDWTVTTAANSVKIDGSISGSTTLTLVLGTSVSKTAS